MAIAAAALKQELPSVLTDNSRLMSMPLSSIPTDVPLQYPVYVKVNDKFVLFRNAGDVLTSERSGQLASKNVESAFISKDDLKSFVALLEKGLQAVGIRANPEIQGMGLRNLLHVYWKVLEEKKELDQTLFNHIKDATAKVPLLFAQDRSLAVKLLKRYQSPIEYYSNHSVNVSLYAVAIGMKVKLSEDELRNLALAGCAANIGIIEIPREILYKPGDLDEKEWAVMKAHPKRSEEILKLLFAPAEVAQAAGEHHERFDGSGYPSGKKGEEISVMGRILSIAEVYNALTSNKPWSPAVSATEAVDMMGKMDGRFDTSLLSFVVK